MMLIKVAALLACYTLHVCATHSQYQFSTDLDNGGSYKLHWSFNVETKIISFAVNVSTTGWVGFGLSPNGGMAGSDVVIGWVENSGQVNFKDRHASGEFLPSIDESQDWFLVSGAEENGYTILEFTRNLTTCDEDDLDIKPNTARIIWSYHSADPLSEDVIPIHEKRGAASLNLLGRLPETNRVEDNTGEIQITTSNVTIPPEDTTYWCVVHKLPEHIRQQERYIYKFSPVITDGNLAHVHHMIVYLCENLNDSFVDTSDVCTDVHLDIRTCRDRSIIIADWLFGGQDTNFPQDVALPIGGEDAFGHYLILELHYDNPSLVSGTIDSSGFRFLYTDTPPQYRAGVITFGGTISPHTVIPPGADKFVVTALLTEECSTKHFPPEGINLFGSALHTHLAGDQMFVQHFRETENCSGTEELKPIDEDRQYDFNYQQFNILPEEIKVLPGDKLQIQCHYKTTDSSYLDTGVTLAGFGTRDEMCFVFLYYYPETNISLVISAPETPAYKKFASRYLNESMQNDLEQSLQAIDFGGVRSIMNTVDWSQGDTTEYLQALITNSTQTSICLSRNPTDTVVTIGRLLPTIDCPYVEADICAVDPTNPSLGIRNSHSPILLHVVWVVLIVVSLLT